MTGRERLFVIILIVNFLLTVLFLIFNLFRKEDKRASCWFRAAVMLLFPVTGIIVFFAGYVFFHVFFHREVDLADVVFSKERTEQFHHADEDRERNLVPVEEAIRITDNENLRTLMLNVARGDIQKSLASIAAALESPDSETAHYAASILQNALNDFRAQVQKQYQYMQDNEEERAEYAHILIPYMDQVLKQQVFTEMEQRGQVEILDSVCEMLYTAAPETMETAEFEAISLRLLEMREFGRSKVWCDRAVVWYPDTLSTYTCQLKLYFTTGERDEFFRVMEALRKSKVVVDRETLELIRVFM